MIFADSNLCLLFTIATAVLALLTLINLCRYVIFRSMDTRQVDDSEMQAAYAKLAVDFPASRELKKAMLYGAATALVAGAMFTF
ncbi:hypothetical protein [Pseudomonas sp. NPDC089569]|uniref:hypothetical protein n=1 Tax=Pseudomonas sp. NPDC089569 TaxID=3390722 RepID=UPI003CFC7B28